MAMNYVDRIKKHEDYRNKPYRDSIGLLTVGRGRCIDRVPFSDDEIELMFQNDLKHAIAGAETFGCYYFLDDVRRGVLIEMVFQLGINGVAKFKKFLDFAMTGDFRKAADEMIDSKWYTQTPQRCEELASIFEKGY
jgi:lysozyme